MLKTLFPPGTFPSAFLLSLVSLRLFPDAPGDLLPAGVLAGSFLILTIFHLFLFFAVSDRAFLALSAAVAPYGLFLLLSGGPSGEAVLPLIALCGGAALGGTVLSARTLLGLRDAAPAWYRGMLAAALLLPLVFAAGAFLVPAHWRIEAGAAAAAAVVGALLAAVLRYGYRMDGGRLLLTAALFLVLAFPVLPVFLPDHVREPLIGRFGFLPATVAGIFQVLLLSLAAGFRIRALAHDRDRSRRLALDTLRDVDRLKDDILATITHTLKTPMQGIIGIVSSLIDGSAGLLSGRAQDSLQMVLSSARKLSELVGEILDYSMLRNTNTPLSIRPLNVRRLAESVAQMVRPQLVEKELSLELRIPENLPPVMADVLRLQQVLFHLTANAVQYTREGSVSIWAELQDGSVRIGVSDTGIGIPQDKLEAVFEPFTQTETEMVRRSQGAGLGLAIARSLIQMHGSTISVRSEPGTGSTFSFLLDAGEEAQDDSPEEDLEPVEEENGNGHAPAQEEVTIKGIVGEKDVSILLVDDEPANLHVLASVLALKQYSVVFARSGEEAFRMLARGDRIDLIIIERRMPDMSGYVFCRKLRQNYPMNELPVLMVTGKHHVSALVKGLGSGANDYLLKPFSREELYSRITTHLKISRLHRSFTRFIPMEFLRHLGKLSIDEVHLGDNVQKEMTIMFADIRGFTEMSENMSPEDNFRFLNSYLTRVGPVIRRHGGFVDKYIGDAVMALFSEGVDEALHASIEMQTVVADYNRIRIEGGWKPISIGIGIHTGHLMLGTIGEEERLEGTVISDSVNTTSRIESLTKFFGTSILISERTFMLLADPTKFEYRFLGKIQVKGRRQYVSIFDIFNGDPEDIVELKRKTQSEFERAVHLYFNREFTAAAMLFRKVLAVHPTDKAANYYLQESTYYETNGTPEEWNGIFRTEHYLTV